MQEIKLNGESMNIVDDNIEKLKTIFPDVFTEGKVDFDKLQNVLGNYIEKKDERYNFTWNGKSAALRLAQTPSTGTLRPCKEDSKNWDTTENLYIEGDNLEVLKLLQKSYHNKIKMIYIDPPYNTGSDFVYKDDFKDNITNYKKTTGQIDNEGNKLSSNSESDGRYHTNWLNMIYPRLRLARNLLCDDGVIFISIDENEVRNLRHVCDEIFGEDNFVGDIIRKTKSTTEDVKSGLNIQHEYLCVYAKKVDNLVLHGIEKDFSNYKNPDNDPNGDWCSGDPSARSGGPSTYFPIKNPYTGREDYPPNGRYWAFSQSTLENYIKTGKIKFRENYKDSERGFTFKRYKKDITNLYNSLDSLFGIDNEYMNQTATKETHEIINDIVFDYPKPVAFIKKLVYSCLNNDFIVLDFFSGSATTAHAVMKLNSEDNGCRKYILVQLPELTDEKSDAYKAGYKNICEIGKERIRRSGEIIKEEVESNNAQLKLGEEPKIVPDIGFKLFKLDTSNIKKWNGNSDTIESEIQGSIFNYEVGRSELDVVYEIMLKCGLDLTYPIEEININGKILYSIGAGAMFVCMDNDITQDIADKIIKIKDANDIIEPVAVFKDNGFKTDSNKTNIKETLRVAGIKDFITV